jgi:DNA-binding MarR family transcriptional regulator
MGKISDEPSAARAMALAGDLRAVIGQLKRRLREQTQPHGLTEPQIAVLGRLEREGPATVTALARAEGVRPQSMGETVAALQSADLVHGAPDPQDGRQTLLSLTPACREMIRAGRAKRQDWLFRTIRQKLSAQEQKELAHAVELLKRLVDPKDN